MARDEPWTWYHHADSDMVFLRRAGSIAGLPNDVASLGTSEARKNGKYLDFAIPVGAVSRLDMDKGDEWVFRVIDDDTIRMNEADE